MLVHLQNCIFEVLNARPFDPYKVATRNRKKNDNIDVLL